MSASTSTAQATGGAPKGASGKLIVLVLGLAITGAVSAAVYRYVSTRWPSGPLLHSHALSTGGSIEVRRGDRPIRKKATATYVHITMKNDAGDPVWNVMTYGMQGLDLQASTWEGMFASTNTLLAVPTRDHQVEPNPELHIFESATGEFVWRVTSEFRPGDELLFLGDALVHATPSEIKVWAAADGAERRIVPRPENAHILIEDERLFMVLAGERTEVSLAAE